MLRAENLGKRYGNRWIFRGLTFDLAVGRRLLVIGRNGSGKSTLLKTLAGLLSPSEGSVDRGPGDLRRTLGYSAIDLAVYPQLTVMEHLEFTARVRGCEARSEELLGRVGLSHAANARATHLSTGMRARLKLCIAVQANPEILLLDEPGAGLDESGRSLVASIVEEQSQRGCLILATNDPNEREFATDELELDN